MFSSERPIPEFLNTNFDTTSEVSIPLQVYFGFRNVHWYIVSVFTANVSAGASFRVNGDGY